MNLKYIAIVSLLFAGSAALTSCYDDSGLKERIDKVEDRVDDLETQIRGMNTDIVSIKNLVAAISNGAVITGVEETHDGFKLTLSDGRVLTINHGKDGVDGENGADGKDAPVIGVAEENGVWYWTLTIDGKTDWIVDASGNKLPVTGPKGDTGDPGQSGEDGRPGDDGKTPVIGVKDGFWTVDYGSGPQFILDEKGEKVRAVPEGGSGSLLKSVVPGDDEIVFTLVSGETFSVPRVDNFGLSIDTSDPYFAPGETRIYDLELNGVSDIYVSNVTEGWKASVAGNKLKVSAPESATTGDKADVRIIVVNKRHDVRAFKISVEVMNVRTLTFEDADYKGKGNMLGNHDWSSLIDSQQYGGPLLYPNSSTRLYNWYDEGNTELASELVNSYGDFKFWSGGMAVSNYTSKDLSGGDYMHQLAVYYQSPDGKGGHGGSDNFCIQNGYKDTNPDGYAYNNVLPALYFKDGKARVVKSMWVMTTLYFVNVWKNGNGLSAPGGNNTFKIVVYAYDESGSMIANHPEFILADGSRIMEEWTKIDLSQLGKVSKLTFNLECGVDNGYGMSMPAYFAFDDVEVLFD